ncbi:DUF2948 family protein [Paenirhodobacter populi]|uniref:DUF2948 family protein n=1 Tax=Paenirhodobacter populi TaxID=2306993 RepID=A0A443J7E2_9RHOB|nr:DUF2948 family protein [Sinirhodobacter populi]RWR07697.1 DUF2948 family protein [Sinirhodobacter populi]RWR13431.1 DUF2948 family protein [Sinirhodobacter populi]RWR16367.1 DUF2948 family protein [Sinirhodobacter populi]RWR34024.1 DUF2948 family protein [Sinirhodobacter populi]
MADARFEDGAEGPLALRAETPEDLSVIAALVQDAVFTLADIAWEAKSHRLAFLVNRFRWEDKAKAEAEKRPYERVRALLVFSDVTRVASQGIDRNDRETVVSLLDLQWAEGAQGSGTLTLILAGDGAIAISVECLSIDLRDVTRPYRAVSGEAPRHKD